MNTVDFQAGSAYQDRSIRAAYMYLCSRLETEPSNIIPIAKLKTHQEATWLDFLQLH